MTAYTEILNKWADYTKYDENQTSFNLLSMDYTLHQKNKNIQKLLNRYDHTGRLSLLYAKYIMEASMKVSKITVHDAVCNPDCIQETITMWNLFQKPEVIETESQYAKTLRSFSQRIAGHVLLGDMDDSALLHEFIDALDDVIEQLDGCKVDIFKKSGNNIGKIENFSTSIMVYETLAECLLNLDAASDGVYLCYIRHQNTAEGYFGFFIVSSGNILCISDRCDEAYMGQHQNSRNGRWAESKRDKIFPYDYIFSFSQHDYKGYASVYEIDEEKLRFFNLTPKVYMPILVAMLLIGQEYSGSLPDLPETYVNSLFYSNILPVIESGTLHLPVPVDEKNELIAFNSSYRPEFTKEDIVSGKPSDRFNYNGSNNRKVSGYFGKAGDIFVELYGEGFNAYSSDSAVETGLQWNYILPEHSGNSNNGYIPEFVGSRDRMDMEVYRQARKKLAEYISDRMYEEYTDYGGGEAIFAWYRRTLENRKSQLIQLCIDKYIERSGEIVHKSDSLYRHCGTHDDVLDCHILISDGCSRADFTLNQEINQWRDQYFSITGEGKCTLWFSFYPDDWKSIARILGEDIPKIVKGWWNNRFCHGFGENSHYNGNSLLDATDAVCDIVTPFNQHNRDERYRNPWTDFSFRIGFSKREFNKLVKIAKKKSD